MKKKIRPWAILFLLTALFLGMFAVYGPGVYNDSDQYIKMHIHREPLYPLFLFLLRTLFGEGWLTAMGILQNILAAVSIWMLAEYVRKRFSLVLWQEIGVIVLQLLPHMMTKYVSSLHLFMTNSVMSEALCLPLFTLFTLACLQILLEEKPPLWGALILAVLLSLTRTQMMLAVLMWAAAAAARGMMRDRKKILRTLFVTAVAVTIALAGRMLAVKSYNLIFNGHFMNNTYGTVNTLTNILYAADREDGDGIEDESARAFFYKMYDLTEENRANYKYAGNSWKQKAEHIEAWHDTVKYEMIENVFYQAYNETVTQDYIQQNVMADETAGKMIAGILPGCFLRWFGNYLLIAGYGLIRSIAVVHPLINPVSVLIYLSAAVLMGVTFYKDYQNNRKINSAALFMAMAFFAVFANAFAVGLTIMALSRYMIYGFALFYTAFFMLIIEGMKLFGGSVHIRC